MCYPQTYEITYVEDGEYVYSRISQLPGNLRTIVFHDVVTYSPGRGLGSMAHQNRLWRARENFPNAKTDICTVRDDNAPQIKILQKNGWSKQCELYEGVSLWSRPAVLNEEECI